MPFNLLLLPLLGGFIFVRNWKRSRYFALRSEGHVLLFYAATAGAISLIIVTLLSYFVTSQWPSVYTYWHKIVPVDYSGKALVSGLLAALAWIPLNWFLDDKREIDRVIQYRQNPLEMLFRNAMEERKLVALSVKSGKVYVGYIISNFNPAFQLDSIGIIPMISGYRDKDKRYLVFTTRYIDAYDKIAEENRARVTAEASVDTKLPRKELDDWIRDELDNELNNFRHVILIREIETAFIFRIDIYEKYFYTEGRIDIS